jgi:hypothetical protein
LFGDDEVLTDKQVERRLREYINDTLYNGQAHPVDIGPLDLAASLGTLGAKLLGKAVKEALERAAKKGVKSADEVQELLQDVLDQAVKEVDELGLRALTPAERAQVLKNPEKWGPVNRGKAIERAFRDKLNKEYKDIADGFDGLPNKGPDLVDKVNPANKLDITTSKAFPKHKEKYGDDLKHLDTGPIPEGWGGPPFP